MESYLSKISEAVGMLKQAKKVLVVEDERDINELLCYNLLKAGFLPLPVYDGCEAKNKLDLETFDIVILDLMLPGIDGFTLCRKIKDSPQGYKSFVIILTAKENLQDKLYAHILGADYYLTKPFNMGMLLNIVKELDVIQEKDFKVSVNGSGAILNNGRK
jgi:two-component system response regulator VicR